MSVVIIKLCAYCSGFHKAERETEADAYAAAEAKRQVCRAVHGGKPAPQLSVADRLFPSIGRKALGDAAR